MNGAFLFNIRSLCGSVKYRCVSSIHEINRYLLYFITGRNEVVAKVIFLHPSVILFTGGVSASVHAGIPHCPPPRSDTPEQTPPRSRHTPQEQADTPPGSRHPPRNRHTPGKQTPVYGQWAAGTHPTWMHSCSCLVLTSAQRTRVSLQ